MDRLAPDKETAEAMNRVLAAEREAAEAIAAAQRSAESVIEAARVKRRRILDTARRRATRMHVRAQARLEKLLQELEAGGAGPDRDVDSLRTLAQDALRSLAGRLTGGS